MLKRGDHGPAVTQLQNNLLELGYPLPKWGADGDLGGETLGAVADLLEAHQPNVEDASTDVVTDGELKFIDTLLADVRARRAAQSLSNLIDRRQYTGLNKDMGPRTWPNVKGWCLHQTACNLHASSDIARCDNVGAHWVVYPDGRKFQLHHIDRIIIHGNGWNNQTIGIEIDGLFAGVEGDPKTVWDDPSTTYKETAGTVTAAQIQAVKEIIRHDHAIIKSHGGIPTVIVAHRQASKDRRNDPGSKIWQQIAMPMNIELGLNDGGPGFEIGGYPIPEAWDPSRRGVPY